MPTPAQQTTCHHHTYLRFYSNQHGETIERFFANRSSVLYSVPTNDKLILLGDLNECVGGDYGRREGVLGKHRVGKIKSKDLLLLGKFAVKELPITNTLIRQANKVASSIKTMES